MSDAVDDIRKRYEKAVEPHTCRVRTITQAELVGMPPGDILDGWCRTNVLGADGKVRFHVTRGCRPIVDEDWLRDTKALLDYIDKLESMMDRVNGESEWRTML